ncbi:hypothetical protein FDP41_010693 [Naegleria fowleri]|uniref:Uncharacterized protein n=1 Tax=Naegleria fowleri TaxID=5763 RepID=A0A6A5CDP2_NAEFO|nr:uncharacterized protein FDP41_010693 [Naegleria fowleri]KAF0983628.1 hypothetical protein FDP41_010693 [Naegleria fowleri]
MSSPLRDQRPSLFLQIFLQVTYWEPFIFELLVGVIFMLFPNSSLVLGTFLPKTLVAFMLSNEKTVNILSDTSILKESILFILRFAGVMIFCFGMLHYLLIRVNFNILSNNNPNNLVSSKFFHLTVLVLGIGDLLHVGAVLVFLKNYYSIIPEKVALSGDAFDAVSMIAIAIVSSIILVSLRIFFLLKYSSMKK